jgi:endonuclease/exonuclease/phosphatase family metal-dependent hydrolase
MFAAACGADATSPDVPSAATTSTVATPVPTTPTAPPKDAGSPTPTGKSGTFTVLSYNVAGLPKLISSVTPEVDVKLISPKLNVYDVVLAQEDFAYHKDLISQLTLPYRTKHKGAGTVIDMGDGLSTFSKFVLTGEDRDKWQECNGLVSEKSDCFAPKGLLKTTLEFAPGLFVDVYNIHTDAGRVAGDVAARDKQVVQLNAKIAAESAGKPVIVGGDTNMKDVDETTLQSLLSGSNLTDACRKLSCPNPNDIDRVMFRDGAGVKFSVKEWKIETNFKDANGKELSDHEPVKVTLEWTAP